MILWSQMERAPEFWLQMISRLISYRASSSDHMNQFFPPYHTHEGWGFNFPDKDVNCHTTERDIRRVEGKTRKVAFGVISTNPEGYVSPLSLDLPLDFFQLQKDLFLWWESCCLKFLPPIWWCLIFHFRKKFVVKAKKPDFFCIF